MPRIKLDSFDAARGCPRRRYGPGMEAPDAATSREFAPQTHAASCRIEAAAIRAGDDCLFFQYIRDTRYIERRRFRQNVAVKCAVYDLSIKLHV
jgi:hypothetical protein